MASYKVGYFVGSLSSTSINRRLALALAKFLRSYMAELHAFIVRVLTVLPRTA